MYQFETPDMQMFFDSPWKPRQLKSWYVHTTTYKEGPGGYKIARGYKIASAAFMFKNLSPQFLTIWLLENEGKFTNQQAFDYWFNYPKFCKDVEINGSRHFKKVIKEFETRRNIQGLSEFIDKSYLQWMEENLN